MLRGREKEIVDVAAEEFETGIKDAEGGPGVELLEPEGEILSAIR